MTYTFEGTFRDKVFQIGSNTWTFVDGTGLMKGAKATGTCTAKGSPDGGIIFDRTGTYALAK